MSEYVVLVHVGFWLHVACFAGSIFFQFKKMMFKWVNYFFQFKKMMFKCNYCFLKGIKKNILGDYVMIEAIW